MKTRKFFILLGVLVAALSMQNCASPCKSGDTACGKRYGFILGSLVIIGGVGYLIWGDKLDNGLRGQCTLNVGQLAKTPIPCSRILLVVPDEKEKTLASQYTDDEGFFYFKHLKAKKVRLISGDARYKVQAGGPKFFIKLDAVSVVLVPVR